MLVNYVLSPCVRKCELGYRLDGKLVLKRKVLFSFRIGESGFENTVMDHLQNTRSDCKIQSIYITGNQQKIDKFSVDGVDGFCGHCNTVFEVMG